MSDTKRANFNKGTTPPETLTVEESEKLLDELLQKTITGWSAWRNLRNYTIALFMLDAGLRVGEVCRLYVSDLIIAGIPVRALNVSERIAEKRCTRIVPLTPRLIDALTKIQTLLWSAFDNEKCPYAFFNQNKLEHLTTRQIQRIIGAASVRAFNRYIHPHILRHTFATRLMRVTNSSVVQQLLGHKHITSTQVYTHPNGDDCKKAIDGLSTGG